MRPIDLDQIKMGRPPDRLVDLYIDATNQAVAECPDDVIIAIHMCRGNFKGRYLGAGGYESVAERFFARANVNHFLLEYDTKRSGDFAPLRFVPKSKGVVLGLISTKSPLLENPARSSSASKRRAATSISAASPSGRNAALPAPWPATRSQKQTSVQNWH